MYMKMYRTLYHEINTNFSMQMKYRTLYHMKSTTEINTLHVFMKMKYRTLYHMKSITEINTLQCLHENERQNIVSYEKHNRN